MRTPGVTGEQAFTFETAHAVTLGITEAFAFAHAKAHRGEAKTLPRKRALLHAHRTQLKRLSWKMKDVSATQRNEWDICIHAELAHLRTQPGLEEEVVQADVPVPEPFLESLEDRHGQLVVRNGEGFVQRRHEISPVTLSDESRWR